MEVHLSWLLLVFLGPVLVFALIVVAWVRIRARNREVLTYWSGRRKSPTDAASSPTQPGVAPPPGTPGTPSLLTAPASPFEAQVPPEGRAHAPRPPSAQPLNLPRVPATGNGPSPLSAGEWSGFRGPEIVHVAQARQRAQSIAMVARTSCPAHVIAGREFPVGIVVDRPTRDEAAQLSHILTRHVIAPGFTHGVEQSWRAHINVSALSAFLQPSDQVRLTAEHGTAPTETRDVHILLLADGHPVAIDSRSVTVHEDPTAAGASRPAEVKALPYRAPTTEAADLTVYILKEALPGRLHWAFVSRHDIPLPELVAPPHQTVTVPDDPLSTSIGDQPHAFVRKLIARVDAAEGRVRATEGAEGASKLYRTLIGLGDEIAACMPPDIWRALSDIAARVRHRPPTVLIISDEPHVPWELAQMPTPLRADAPPLLAAQVVVGRWMHSRDGRPPLPPRSDVEVRSMATISGDYAATRDWPPLPHAREEADTLRTRYGAEPVEGTLANIERLLERAVVPDALHFAMHGLHDPDGVQDGLITVDADSITPEMVRGYTLANAPFVFLNACQVGSGQSALGTAAGVAPAFLRAGASAVIAPLWSVSDSIAKELTLWFYEQIRTGIPPGEALRAMRTRFRPEGDGRPLSATCLAFRLYGHPKLVVHFNPRPVDPVSPVSPVAPVASGESASSAASGNPAGSAGTTA